MEAAIVAAMSSGSGRRLRLNGVLATGLLLIMLMSILALAGPALALYPRGYQDNFVYVETEEGTEMFVSPLAPMPLFPFGSDPYGKDIFSLMMYGARYSTGTVCAVSLLRIFLAFLFIILFDRSGKQRRIRRRKTPLSGLNAIPQFIIIYFILYSINFNSPLSVPVLTLLQWLLLVLFGFPALVPPMAAEVESIRKMEFISAARSTGAGPGHILFRHILPHMKEKLLLLFSRETVEVLSLIGQLGIFNIFIGGTYFTPAPPLFHSISNEWAGLVGQYRMKLQPGSWWILLFPLIGFVLLLLSFYLVSRGLEKAVRERYRRV